MLYPRRCRNMCDHRGPTSVERRAAEASPSAYFCFLLNDTESEDEDDGEDHGHFVNYPVDPGFCRS